MSILVGHTAHPGDTAPATPLRKRPALHFLLLGLILFTGDQYLQWRASYQVDAPDPKTLNILFQDWQKQTGRFPSPEQQAQITQAEIDSTLLFNEALRRKLYQDDSVVYQRLLRDAAFLGIGGSEREQLQTAVELDLHKGDEVIRRRLIQRMESIGRHVTDKTEPSADILQARYDQQLERWKQAPRLQINQVFFSSDQPAAQQRAEAALAQVNLQQLDLSQAIALGDAFLMGNRLPLQDSNALSRTFGEHFTEALLEQYSQRQGVPTPAWLGPIASSFGVHLVQVTRFEPTYYRSLQEVTPLLRDEYFRDQETIALQRFLSDLRDKYEITPR